MFIIIANLFQQYQEYLTYTSDSMVTDAGTSYKNQIQTHTMYTVY